MKETNHPQLFLKALLVFQLLLVSGYTLYVIQQDGWILIDIFINDVSSMNWNGQFNLDFSSYLLLSGLWIMWRNEFSVGAIAFGIAASVLGIIAFAPYVLYLVIQTKGNLPKVLIGDRN